MDNLVYEPTCTLLKVSVKLQKTKQISKLIYGVFSIKSKKPSHSIAHLQISCFSKATKKD